MKAILFCLFSMACATLSYGQKVEFAGQLNSSSARFGGESAASSTFMLHSISSERSNTYTNSPYGHRFALSYGAAVQVQRVTRHNLLLGVQGGAEALRHKIDVEGVHVVEASPNAVSAEYKTASGKTILQNDFVNLHPYLGYRVSTGPVDFDFSLGPEVGFGLRSREKGEATAEDGSGYTSNFRRSDPETDVRGRVGVTAYYRHLGLSVSYSHGVTNYLQYIDGANPELYARVLRLGIQYRL